MVRSLTAVEKSLPGATVVAVHGPTGSQFGTVTNLDGRYNLQNMNVGGPYKITVSFVGFETYERNGIYLTLGQQLGFDVVLGTDVTELEGVEIVASRSDVFDGNRTGSETVVGEEMLGQMPNASRSLNDFTRLTPQASFTAGGGLSIAGMNNRFNAIFIDGAVNNDVFGLAANGNNGGQIGIPPISIDAIEQVQVVLAPYDVRLGGFAGGGINAVTRSGTNEFEGSAWYLLRNEGFAGETPTNNLADGADREKLDEFKAETYGIRLGGPIVKNKLFFFALAEIQRDETPQPFDFGTYTGGATRAQVDAVAAKLRNEFGYEPGGYENTSSTLEREHFIGKLDWNISNDHKLSIRHSYTNGESVGPGTSGTRRIRFANAGVLFPSVTNSTALELKSNYNEASNNLIIGYTKVRDDRDPIGQNFPWVDIDAEDITFGSEQFSTANVLDQDILTITNNYTVFRGKHTITLGTHNEYSKFRNVFIRQNFGAYEFDNVDDFLNGAAPVEFVRSFSNIDLVAGDDTDAAAEFKTLQLGVYLQDEIQVNDKLKLTAGLRLDVPTFLNAPATNDHFNNTTIPMLEAFGYDLQGARTGATPKTQLMLSPRLGFNYDLKGDQTTQVRGGIGIFTSRIPFVWPGAMYNNNGVFVGGTFQTSGLVFNPDPNTQFPSSVSTDDPSGQIDIFAEDFKFPQIVRASLALDKKLPWWGLIGTVDVQYTKTLNNVFYENVNLKPSVETLQGTPDNRPYFDRRDEIDPTYTRVLLGSNTSKGYTYSLTGQLQKPFDNGLTASLAYTYGGAESVFEGTSSQNSSQWRGALSINGRNNTPVAISDFDLKSRIVAALSYRLEYDFGATTFSMFYNGQSGQPFSYVYDDGGSLNNEDSRERSLIYVPRTSSEIVFADASTAAAQWAALDAYIENDDYLKDRRGQYAEKNAARLPFQSVVDFKIMQEISMELGGKRRAIEISFDIFNFTNLLNKDWGRRWNSNNATVQLMDFEGFQTGGLVPTFEFNTDDVDVEDLAFPDDGGLISSRWQAQLGLRVKF